MKKFLSFALVAMMIIVAAVSVSAVEWVAGDGYDVYSGASYSEATAVEKSPVTMTVNEDGSATVEQGGYYCNYKGDNNYGGVATAEKVGLDGLEVVINFEEVPAPTNDCWFGVLLVQEPHPFNTGDMGPTGGYNPLIRFNVPNVEFYTPTFSGLPKSDAPAGMFGLQSGDTLKMNVEYKLGQYYVTYTHNDMVYEVPADRSIDATNLFLDQEGKAYVVVTGTLLGDQCDWKYTVNVTPGEGISEEDLANREFEQSKGSAAAEINTYVADIAKFLEDAKELAGDNASEDVVASITAIEEAVAGSDALVTAIEEAADADAVDVALQAAKDARKLAADSYDAVALYIEMFGAEEAPAEETEAPVEETEAPAEDEVEAPVDETTEAPAEEGGNSTLIIVIVVIVVVIIIIAAVVLGKKKKN